MKKLLLVALSTFAMSANAWEPTFYAGSSFSTWIFKDHSYGHNFGISALEGVGGAYIFPYISVEARAGAGLTSSTEGDYKVGMDYYASAYFRPYLSNEKASLYGLLGVTTLGISVEELGTELDQDPETGVSYGLGVSFTTSERTQLTAEWKRLMNAEEFDMRGGSIGFTYKF
jgi:Outer membrane protein beta-barrel domain